MTATDVDTTLEIDITKQIPCFHESCDRPAEWRVINRCEGRHAVDLCVVHQVREHQFHEQHCDDLVCKRCEQPLPHPHVRWRHL